MKIKILIMLTLSSSIFSFVDFNAEPQACNDAQMNLPAVNTFAIKFQFKITDAAASFEPWVAPVIFGVPVILAKIKATRLCGRLSLTIPAFPVTITTPVPGGLPILADGNYTTEQDLLVALNAGAEFVWQRSAGGHFYTDSCCINHYPGSIEANGTPTFYQYDFMYYHAAVPAVPLDLFLQVGDCFNYAVYSQDPEVVPGSLMRNSNIFKRTAESCFLSFVDYYSDKDCFDFSYNCAFSNTAWLPLYFGKPTNPTNENVYIESSGRRRVLSATLDEEYTAQTDRLTQWLHRKIEAMLLHDHKYFTNTYFGLITESLTKNGPYNKEWDEDVNVMDAPATTKLVKNLSNFNSGCCQEEQDCCDNSGAVVCGVIDDLTVLREGDGTEWSVQITGCSYSSTPTYGNNQSVAIEYRERYSVGAFTAAGSIVFDTLGNIVSSFPDPFIITGIPDSFQEIEIRVYNNSCDSEFIYTTNNPCETMAGVIATGELEMIGIVPGWKVVITDVVFSNFPDVGETVTINVSAREYGSAGPFLPVTSFTYLLSAGPTVTLTPSPAEIGTFDGAWDRVELLFEYGCSREHLQVFSNPLATCIAVSEVDIIDIEPTAATATWPAVSPAPSGLYDWELYTGSFGGTLISSGTGYWNPGSLVLALTGLTTATHYYFRVRANCGAGEYSIWANAEFDTL